MTHEYVIKILPYTRAKYPYRDSVQSIV